MEASQDVCSLICSNFKSIDEWKSLFLHCSYTVFLSKLCEYIKGTFGTGFLRRVSSGKKNFIWTS